MDAERNVAKQYCGFKIGGIHYAIPVLSVQEVVKPQSITPVPLSQEHVAGLINLRGQIVTSVSLRKLFGLEDTESEEYMNIIVRGNDSLVSFIVDEIMDVFDVEESQLEETPDTLDKKMKTYVSHVYKLDDELIILLEIDKLVNF